MLAAVDDNVEPYLSVWEWEDENLVAKTKVWKYYVLRAT